MAKIREKMAYSSAMLVSAILAEPREELKRTRLLVNNLGKKTMLPLILCSSSTSKGPGQPKKERASLELERTVLYLGGCKSDSHNRLLALPPSLPQKTFNELEGSWTCRTL